MIPSLVQDFKREVDPHMVEVESLNRQAKELCEQTSSEQARALRQPLDEINRRWTTLLRGLVERQRELENALLRLGQFQHALGELLVWMARTERALDEGKPVAGDAQVIEVELAKHKVSDWSGRSWDQKQSYVSLQALGVLGVIRIGRGTKFLKGSGNTKWSRTESTQYVR